MLKFTIDDLDDLFKVAHALSSKIRLKIIRLLNTRTMNINEIADVLHIPISTAASNIKVLEKAGLILTELQPATRGAMKICTRNFDNIQMVLNTQIGLNDTANSYEIEMPIGHYIDCEVVPTCGIANKIEILNSENDSGTFFHPNRISAQLIWFRQGYMEYKFPISISPHAKIESIQFSVELCSEVPNHDNNWPSDITAWVNGVELGTWTSPGDLGDRRGKLNPLWWPDYCTQYGMLKTWKVDSSKSSVDDVRISSTTRLEDLNLSDNKYVCFRLGIKPDAVHKGGINIFGKEFGDYSQDIIMKIIYTL